MLTATVIGLRSAIVLLCISGLVALMCGGLPNRPANRWRVGAWGSFLATTALVWSPLAFLNAVGGKYAATMGTIWGDGLRLIGALGYLGALMCATVARTYDNGGNRKRAQAAVSANVMLITGCVVLAYLATARWI